MLQEYSFIWSKWSNIYLRLCRLEAIHEISKTTLPESFTWSHKKTQKKNNLKPECEAKQLVKPVVYFCLENIWQSFLCVSISAHFLQTHTHKQTHRVQDQVWQTLSLWQGFCFQVFESLLAGKLLFVTVMWKGGDDRRVCRKL